MKENGKIIGLKERGSFGILVEIIMKENGKRIELVEKENICIKMEQNMKEIGLMMYHMDLELKSGPISLDMKGNINLERKKDPVNIFGMMAQFILDNGVKIY